MTLSRMHLGMLGVVSIFTGVISPVISNSASSFPFPLTDLQIPAYIILICLAIICILLAVRAWSWAKFFCLIVLGLIGYLFIVTWSGEVRTTTGILARSLSWGWVFLFIGSGLLISSMFDSDDIEEGTPTLADHLLGWLGAVAILTLTGLIIAISYVPKVEKNNNSQILKNIFGTGGVTTLSGITKSNAYTSIDSMVFDRKNDTISFLISSGTSMISLPGGRIFDRLPYAQRFIGNTLYTISAEGYVTTNSGTILGKAILPQTIDQSILMYSGNTLVSVNNGGIQTYSGEYTDIENIVTSRIGNHTIWKGKTGTGYTLYRDGKPQGKQQNNITSITISSDGSSIMSLVREADGSRFIIKDGNIIEQVGTGYIEGSLRMNGNDRIYAIEKNNVIELVYNGSIIDRKFDEIREIFLDYDGGGYSYFGRPLGEQSYCFYTRYRGNLCGLSGYMNPRQSPDGLSVIYAGLKDGAWGIYKNVTPLIRNTGYPNRENISRDYVFFDITNPTYYLFIRGDNDGYRLFKKGTWVEGTWKDIGLDVSFGYDYKIIMSAQDMIGWRILEF